jgi:hypothetical protein
VANHVVDVEKRCEELHGKVRDILQMEPVQIRINVLLASLFGATANQPHQTWAPYLANFLAVLAQRDGVFIGVSALDDEETEDISEEGGEPILH